MINQRGQEFSGFRLLVDAILVLLILVIIMGILGWVDSVRFQISEKRLYEGFVKAVNSPDGKTIMEKDIMLKENTYVTAEFVMPSVSKKCIRFEALDLSALELSENRQLEVKSNVQLDMYYRCLRNLDGDDCAQECGLCCTISFGKEFEEE